MPQEPQEPVVWEVCVLGYVFQMGSTWESSAVPPWGHTWSCCPWAPEDPESSKGVPWSPGRTLGSCSDPHLPRHRGK